MYVILFQNQPTTPDTAKSRGYTSRDDDIPFASIPSVLAENPFFKPRAEVQEEIPTSMEVNKEQGREAVEEVCLKTKERLSLTGRGLMLARQFTSFNAVKRSREEKVILKGISLYFNPGEMIGIMGPSGKWGEGR